MKTFPPLLLLPGRKPSRRLSALKAAAGGLLLLALFAWGGAAWLFLGLRALRDADHAGPGLAGSLTDPPPGAERPELPSPHRALSPDRLLLDLQQALQSHPVQLLDYRIEPVTAAVPQPGASVPSIDLLRLRGSTRWQGRYVDVRSALREWASRHPGLTLTQLEVLRPGAGLAPDQVEARLDFVLLDLPAERKRAAQEP